MLSTFYTSIILNLYLILKYIGIPNIKFLTISFSIISNLSPSFIPVRYLMGYRIIQTRSNFIFHLTLFIIQVSCFESQLEFNFNSFKLMSKKVPEEFLGLLDGVRLALNFVNCFIGSNFLGFKQLRI